MKIRDIMKRGPWTIGETDTLGNAQLEMTRHRIRHLPVISEGKLVGMLSERDLLSSRAHADPDDHWWKLPIGLAMQPPETVDLEERVDAVAARMGTSKVGAFAVTEGGKLVGVVSVIDVLLAQNAAVKVASARTAADAMTADPPTVHPEHSLLDAVRLMCTKHIHEIPVVDDAGRVVGMVTESDVRRRVGDPASYLESRNPAWYDVQDVMDAAVTPVRGDSSMAELAHYFADARIDAIPVVDDRGALVGVVSYIDTLNALAS